MVSDQIVLPYLWRRYLSFLRALVGAACLWVVLASTAVATGTWVIFVVVLTIYSLVSIFWRWPERIDRLDIFNLILDVVTFLLCVALSDADSLWLAAVAALYLFLAMATLQDWRDVLLTTVLSLAFVISARPPNAGTLEPLLLILGMFGCVVALQKQSLIDRLSNTSRQAVLYRKEAQQAREAERERIAADFHDGPLQSFISIQMRLEIVRKMLERNFDAGMAELKELREICGQQVTEVRTFVRSMRPVEVDGAGLAAALRSTVGFFQKDSGIPATFKVDPGAMHDDIDSSTEVVQIVREALNNVRKHSGASRVAVGLARADNTLLIDVEDDGTGFPFAGTFSLEELELLRIGPLSIQRRVRGLSGDLALSSRPGRGSELKIRLPI
ncbi:sensor histidine kinase [Paludibaculum fermentans]|uniref:sensor histidine kinase n=1 Tax=Paludibaculum fermentans TaxID=1473598 RepID=UPI003EB6BA46